MIRRDPPSSERDPFDVIIIGGGIIGVSVALESVARGLRPLLLERADFGEETTANSLRIVHGGLRYLQHLDFRRLRRSVEQRRWWLRTFPTLVRPLPCLMPLYGRGLHRPAVLRGALALNDILSADRNRGVRPDGEIPASRVLSRDETLGLFPGCRRDGLQGAALWTDASMVSPHRLVAEMLHWISAAGGTSLNYVTATGLRVEQGRVGGVMAVDGCTGDELAFTAPVVVNAAGPWSAVLAASFDREKPELFRPSLAFNVLLRKPPPADSALAVAAPDRGSPIRFLQPAGNLTLAGTVHAPWDRHPSDVSGDTRSGPYDEEIERFLDELERAIPGLEVSANDVIRVLWGRLPATQDHTTTLRSRPLLVDHGREGGPKGFLSISAVKFTTAPGVARMVLDQACPGTDADWNTVGRTRPDVRSWLAAPADGLRSRTLVGSLHRNLAPLRKLAEEESVVFAEDLVYRRLDWSLADLDLAEVSREVARLLPQIPSRDDTPPL